MTFRLMKPLTAPPTGIPAANMAWKPSALFAHANVGGMAYDLVSGLVMGSYRPANCQNTIDQLTGIEQYVSGVGVTNRLSYGKPKGCDPGTGPMSVVVICRPVGTNVSGPGGYVIVGKWNSGGVPGTTDWFIGSNAPSLANLSFLVSIAGTIYSADAASPWTLGDPYLVIATRNGAAIVVERFNMRTRTLTTVGGTATTGAINATAARDVKVGELDASNTLHTDLTISALAFFERALTDGERSSLRENPWQLFAHPSSRWLMPEAVVAGADTTLASIVSGAGSVSATLASQILAAASVSGVGGVSGALASQILAAASVLGAGLVSAGLSTQVAAAATIAGVGSTTADLSTAIQVAAIIAGAGSTSASLSVAGTLAATIAGNGSVSAGLASAIRMAAAVAGQGSVAAQLLTKIELAGQILGLGSISAGLVADGQGLSAGLAGQGSVSASLTTAILLGAAIAGAGSLTATLGASDTSLAATVQGQGSVTAGLVSAVQAAAQILGQGAVSGSLSTQAALQAAILGTGSVIATLAGTVGFRGPLVATSATFSTDTSIRRIAAISSVWVA